MVPSRSVNIWAADVTKTPGEEQEENVPLWAGDAQDSNKIVAVAQAAKDRLSCIPYRVGRRRRL